MSDKIAARLRKVRSMIGAMCHEGRPPKMSIPARPDMDEDIVISDAADDAADLIERLQAEKAEMEKDAARWNGLTGLWLASTELLLAQTEDGRWSITQIEAVENNMYEQLIGDTPDAAIDAARKV